MSSSLRSPLNSFLCYLQNATRPSPEARSTPKNAPMSAVQEVLSASSVALVDRPPWPFGGSALLKPVLTIHAGALVHVRLGYMGAATAGDALLDALADKAAHEEGAALDAPVGLGVPGDLCLLCQLAPLSARLAPSILQRLGDARNNERPAPGLELSRKTLERTLWRDPPRSK